MGPNQKERTDCLRVDGDFGGAEGVVMFVVETWRKGGTGLMKAVRWRQSLAEESLIVKYW